MLSVELVTRGLVLGCIYALIAVGLTLAYGLLRILHVAHAGLFALGGYIGVLVANATGSLLLSMLVAACGVGLLSMAVYRPQLQGAGAVPGDADEPTGLDYNNHDQPLLYKLA